MAVVNPMIASYGEMKKPVIAGVCMAQRWSGLQSGSACDMIIASAEAQFGQIFVRVALMPEGGELSYCPASWAMRERRME